MSQTINFDEIFDVVVVGSGAAGLTTALTAAKKGNLKVLLCEKAECFGGTTAYSGGGIWIPSNQRMKEFGFEDTREASETYMNHFLRGSGNRSLISAFLDSGPEMCKWVSDNSELGFIPSGLPDYHMDAPGAKVGRSMIARPLMEGNSAVSFCARSGCLYLELVHLALYKLTLPILGDLPIHLDPLVMHPSW